MENRKRKATMNSFDNDSIDLEEEFLRLQVPPSSRKVDFGPHVKLLYTKQEADNDRKLQHDKGRDVHTFAVDRDGSGSWIYANGTHEELKNVFYKGDYEHPHRLFNYEVIEDGLPMKIHTTFSYIPQLNEDKSTKLLEAAIRRYILASYRLLKEFPNADDILIEICQYPEKVSFHIKLSERCGHVQSFEQNNAFWAKVLKLAKCDWESDNIELQKSASQLRIRRREEHVEYNDWILFIEGSEITTKYNRNLGASKYTQKGKAMNFFVFRETTSLGQISELDWLKSLIMRVSKESQLMTIPSEWSAFSRKVIRERQIRSYQIRAARASSYLFFRIYQDTNDTAAPCIKPNVVFEVSQRISNTELLKLISDLLMDIDPEWVDTENLVMKMAEFYQDKYLDILPRAVQIFLESSYCSFTKAMHDDHAIWLEISCAGDVQIQCFNPTDYTNNGSNMHKCRRVPISPNTSFNLARILTTLWGEEKWNKAMARVYSYVSSPPQNGKHILRTLHAYRLTQCDFHAKTQFFDLFQSHRAYQLTPCAYNYATENDHPGEDCLLINDSSDSDDSIEQNNNVKTENAKETALKVKSLVRIYNPAREYFRCQYRINYDEVEYRPYLNDKYLNFLNRRATHPRPDGSSYKGPAKFNQWMGYAVDPLPSKDPSPTLLRLIKHIMVSSNEEHYLFMITYLAWLVQRPGEKSQIVLALVSAPGTGKSTLAKVLLKIFGPHAIQLYHRRQFSNNFNGHLEGKNLVIMPESYFTGSKDEESSFKTATTETHTTVEKKGLDAKSAVNYWNLIVLSNDLQGFPTSLQDRRIFAPTVSGSMINSAEKVDFFSKLHAAIDYGNEVGEFLYFLLNHPIPEGWTPFGNLPKYTPTFLNAIRESPKSADLNWFLSKVEDGRWFFKSPSGSSTPIIQESNSTDVPSALLWEAYNKEKQVNKTHEKYSQIKIIGHLKAFLSEHLPKNLFDSKKIRIYGNPEPVRGYIFGSMKDIESHLKAKYKFSFGDDEEEVGQMIDTFAPRKKRKVVEHSEFDSMNVEDTSTSDISAISSVAKDKMFEKHDLRAKLQEQGLSVIDNPGNGDCLPYSLIDYLRKVRDYNGNFQTLREEVAEFVFTNWTMLRNYPSMAMFTDAGSVLKWITNVRKSGEWCGQEFAHVVACKYRFRLEILALNNEGSVETHFFAPEGLEDQSETVRLAYVDQPGHYMSVWPNQL